MMEEGVTVYLDFLEPDDEEACHGYTFQPPDGMTFDLVCSFLESLLGHGWEDDVVFASDRINVWARLCEESSNIYIPSESMTRDDVAELLHRKGFTRIDNNQDPDGPLAAHG